VYPALTTSPDGLTPSCGSCHVSGNYGAPAFLAGGDPTTAYATMTSAPFVSFVAVPANSMLVVHGAHAGPALAAATLAIVSTWLGEEVAARNLDASPTVTLQGELGKIGACMLLADFTASGPTVNGQTATASALGGTSATAQDMGSSAPCSTCHGAGDGGFFAVADATTMFSMTQSNLTYLQDYVTGTVDQNGNFSGLVPSNSLVTLIGESQSCPTQGICHPKIDLMAGSATVAAVQQFVEAALARYDNEECE